MASIAKRASGKYRARYRDSTGREHAKHFAKKADAERWLRAEQTKVDRGEWSDPGRGKVTVGAWSAQWLEGQVQLKASTRQRYAGLLRVHVDPTWSKIPLSQVSHAAVQSWVTKLTASGLSGSSVRQAYGVLALVLSLAVRDRRIRSNPAEGVTLPRRAKPDKRFLTADEVASLADAAGPHRLAVLMLSYTGLRFGELAALRVKRVDLMRRRLEIAESVTEVNGVAEFGTPKSHQRRSVPLPRFLVDDMAKLLAAKGPEALVFTAPEGGVMALMNWRRRAFDPAVKLAGLTGLTPHELRHTAASLAVASGASVKDIQRMLGHASAAMTLDVYAGLFEDGLDDVGDRMDATARAAADRLRTANLTRDRVTPLPDRIAAGHP
jgi:integrase